MAKVQIECRRYSSTVVTPSQDLTFFMNFRLKWYTFQLLSTHNSNPISKPSFFAILTISSTVFFPQLRNS